MVAERGPLWRTQQRSVEENAGVLSLRILEQIDEVLKTISRERISKRIVEETVDIPAPQVEATFDIDTKGSMNVPAQNKIYLQIQTDAELHCGANRWCASSTDSEGNW